MATPEKAIPGQRNPDGDWKHLFSYHAFAPALERAEGIYLYDTDGNRYIDASGGPIAMNIAHGDRRVIEAITRQAEKYAYCHPALSNEPRAEVCARIARLAADRPSKPRFVASGRFHRIRRVDLGGTTGYSRPSFRDPVDPGVLSREA